MKRNNILKNIGVVKIKAEIFVANPIPEISPANKRCLNLKLS